MAEFQEVMRQFNRMCGACAGCYNCPLQEPDGADLCSISTFVNDSEHIEREIMKWAVEHPEPKYPTFAEWLNSIGVIIGTVPLHLPNVPVNVCQAGEKMFESIPADIAEKLGIKPKEI